MASVPGYHRGPKISDREAYGWFSKLGSLFKFRVQIIIVPHILKGTRTTQYVDVDVELGSHRTFLVLLSAWAHGPGLCIGKHLFESKLTWPQAAGKANSKSGTAYMHEDV